MNSRPGGRASFPFQLDLDGKILVRKNHAEYPAANDRPAIVHDDLLIVYLDMEGFPSKAIYFDNEGHIINYNITYTDSLIVMTSDKIQNSPRFRLTYKMLIDKRVNAIFEIAPPKDQENFQLYLKGNARKKE